MMKIGLIVLREGAIIQAICGRWVTCIVEDALTKVQALWCPADLAYGNPGYIPGFVRVDETQGEATIKLTYKGMTGFFTNRVTVRNYFAKEGNPVLEECWDD